MSPKNAKKLLPIIQAIEKAGIIETIHWHPASEKPDTDTTVLMFMPAEDETEKGFWDSENDCWRYATGLGPIGFRAPTVSHWAHLPEGPK